MGRVGTTAISLILTPVIYFFAIACTDKGCPPPSFYSDPVGTVKELYQNAPPALQLGPFLAIVGYFAVQLGAHIIFPGVWVDGTVLSNGKKLKYKTNSFAIFVAILSFLGGMTYLEGADWALWVYITDNLAPLAISTCIIATTQAFILYAVSFRSKDVMVSSHGSQGNHFHDVSSLGAQ